MRKRAGDPLGTLWQVHQLQRFPGLPTHRGLAGEDRRDLPKGRWRHRGTQNAQGTHVLRLRQLPQLRFHLVEAAAGACLPRMRRNAGGGEQEPSTVHGMRDDVPAGPGDSGRSG